MIFFNQHSNKNYMHQNFFLNGTGPDPLSFQVCSPFCQIGGKRWDIQGRIIWKHVIYGVRSEHKICFGASLSHTNRFRAWRKHLRTMTITNHQSLWPSPIGWPPPLPRFDDGKRFNGFFFFWRLPFSLMIWGSVSAVSSLNTTLFVEQPQDSPGSAKNSPFVGHLPSP